MRTRRLFLIAALAMAAVAPVAPQSLRRTTIVVLDVTPSFRPRAESLEKIKDVVRNLGPGDTFLMFILGGPFSPRESAFVQSEMAPVPAEALMPATSVNEFENHQRILSRFWGLAEQKRDKILRALERPWRDIDITPVFDMLAYVSQRLDPGAAVADSSLLIFSDLKQDANGVRSALPPKQAIPFSNVSVWALFVPWGADWAEREKAWSNWFKAAGVKNFAMADEAKARLVRPIGPNTTPRVAPKTF